MRTYLIVTVLLLFSWLGAFGIAFGVNEWRGGLSQTEVWDAALASSEVAALQQQSQAEACRSAVSWWNSVKDEHNLSDTSSGTLGAILGGALAGMNELCGELRSIDEP